MDRFNPSLPEGEDEIADGPLVVCLARKEPGLLHEGTSSSLTTTWPTTECVGDVGADSAFRIPESDDGGGGRDGGPLEGCKPTNQIQYSSVNNNRSTGTSSRPFPIKKKF